MTTTVLIHRFARLLVIGLLLSLSNVLGFELPDTSFYLSEGDYAISKRQDGLPTEMLHKKKKNWRITLVWNKKKLQEVTYWRPDSFTDSDFSALAQSIAEGATWNENRVKEEEKKIVAGLEQQWLLHDYEGSGGWMGSGLLGTNRYFLSFRSSPIFELEEELKPLELHSSFYQNISVSPTWSPTRCPSPNYRSCYATATEPAVEIRIIKKDSLLEIWILETSNVGEVADAIKALTPDLYRAYAAELPGLAATESHTVFQQLSATLPGLFNWPLWQLQKQKSALPSEKDYMEMFVNSENRWPYIPIYKYTNEKIDLRIRLHFNGHYQLMIRTFKSSKAKD